MESISRPPHRRKHSTSTNTSSSSSYSSFSFRNPYDAVLLSKGRKPTLEAPEYAEIFAGSPSIPVLEIPGLSERVGPSKPDYATIFGGWRGDDLAVPYEQLFSDALQKTKTRNPSVVESPFYEPGYANSPEETERSSGASDQSIDGIKQQYNMSFSRYSQRNSNESNGKTHVAQLHAVPGFTHFVDGTPHLQKKGNVEPVHSVQRKVSRTWSFNSGVELTKINGVNASGKVNGINIKSHVSLSNTNDNKDLRQSRLPAIAAKDDSKSNDGEYSPPFLYEELDENSVAAVSAATLKKAIEQAQESIRIAKMVMEKRKEGFKDGSKPMSKSCLKVKDKKKTKVHNLSDSKDNNVRATCEKLDPTVSMPNEVYGSFGPAMSHSDSCVNSGKSKVETVTEDVDVANYPTEAFTYMGKNFAPSSSESEMLYNEEDDVENVEQNVAATEPHGDTANSTGLVVNAKCRAVAFESGTVEHIDPSTCSRNKVEPPVAQTETSMENLEQRELIVQSKGPNIVSETEESSPYSSQSVVESLDQCPDINACIKGPESITEQLERALHCSESKQEQEIMQEGGNMRASLTECDGDVGKENCWKKSPECEELVSMNNAKVLKLEFANLQTGLILAKKDTTEKADLDKKAENVSEWKENVQDGRSSGEEENLMLLQEHHKWFESELQWSESIEEEISQPKPEIHQEAEVENISDVVCELEIVDRKLNCEHDEDEGKKPGEDGWNEVEDRCRDISEQEAAENMQMETDISQIPWDVDEITDSYERTRSEENQDKIEFQVVASIRDADEVIDTCCNDSDAFFSNSPRNNTSTVFTKTQESCDVDLNYRAEVYQAADRGFKENDSLPLESEILSEVEENGVGKAVDLEVNKMLRADGFPTCASEGNYFTSSQRKSTIEELSSDNRCVNVDSMDVDHEAVLPKAEEIFETASEIYNASEERTAKINMINLTEFYTDDDKVTEFDSTNVNPVLEQSSESHEEPLWTSTFENVDEVSTPESQACSVNPKDNISHKEEGKDHVSSFDENDNIGEHDYKLNSKDERRDSSTQSHGDSQEMDKFTEAERVGTGQNIKKNENPCGIPTMGQKVATGNQKFEANDYLQRIEAIKRGREREKDRIVVERAIREARERAFVEARERAERAAVERAATEARQRAMAEAREKLDKASVENKLPADKVYNEAKLRAERAAVDRATAEARERALEKAMSQKTYTEARTQTEKLSTERFSTSSRNGLKHSFSSSDLDKFDGTSSESAQRRKARLERHQRIMERAAKALAEKNIRDVLAQKEQAERNRLAESLDADIKRWSTGKESNLRALLSTLQYVLGPDSGWQPLSLAEMITAAAVKKAYRKATLCVHPDKLQQRGASIQQKYICEKVFDLLKAAWNRLNSEER